MRGSTIPIVNPKRLVGSNLRYIESRLPHLRRLLVATPRAALQGSDAALVSTSDGAVIDELRASSPKWILDLHGRLGAEIERLPGYEGIGWAA
jgi:GDP-mannose 6-dehydrogenase